MDPVDEQGHKIIDFSIYDAKQAGFETVVFIIKKEMEEDFKECVGDPISKHMEVKYVFQELEDVPAGFTIPEGRVKPWGTTHALLCCKEVIDGVEYTTIAIDGKTMTIVGKDVTVNP